MRSPDAGLERLRQATGARSDDPRLIGVRLDLQDPASIVAAAKAIDEAVGPPDALVHNAGIAAVACAEEMPFEAWQQLFGTNFFGPVRLTNELLPSMRAAGRGRIVVISSQGGIRGMPSISAYSASKAALERWAESLANEIAPFGLGVTHPGIRHVRDGDHHRADAPLREPERAVCQAICGDRSQGSLHGGPPGEPAGAFRFGAREGSRRARSVLPTRRRPRCPHAAARQPLAVGATPPSLDPPGDGSPAPWQPEGNLNAALRRSRGLRLLRRRRLRRRARPVRRAGAETARGSGAASRPVGDAARRVEARLHGVPARRDRAGAGRQRDVLVLDHHRVLRRRAGQARDARHGRARAPPLPLAGLRGVHAARARAPRGRARSKGGRRPDRPLRRTRTRRSRPGVHLPVSDADHRRTARPAARGFPAVPALVDLAAQHHRQPRARRRGLGGAARLLRADPRGPAGGARATT